jgi:hypothetical protein
MEIENQRGMTSDRIADSQWSMAKGQGQMGKLEDLAKLVLTATGLATGECAWRAGEQDFGLAQP